MSNKARQVVVVGLDGADWRLLSPMVEQGQLPTLARLMEEGHFASLASTIRPESSSAWSSFATGVNPGAHSIFSFVRQQADGYRFRLANGDDIGAPRFWELLSAEKRRVCVLNVPFTYPPRPINGYLVSGMLTPGTHVSFTSPAALQERILQRFDDYCFDASEAIEERDRLVATVRRSTDQQRELALWLLQEEAWDCFVIAFTGPDRLQHFFWPQAGSREHPLLTAHYQALDEAIGQIVAHLEDDGLLLLLSDHGFNAVGKRFFINRWLHRQGLLSVHSPRLDRQRLVGAFSRLKEVPWLRKLKQRFLPDTWGPSEMRNHLFMQEIDWHNTRVYFAPDGGLRVNLAGREPQGIVAPGESYRDLHERLQHDLSRVEDESGHPVVAHVFPREEIYEGPFTSQAPDLIVEPQRLQAEAEGNFIIDGSLKNINGPIFGSVEPYAANHAPQGIFLAWGDGVKPGVVPQELHLTDLAPTILAAQDVAIPEAMDGRALRYLFKPGYLAPLRFSTSPDGAPPAGGAQRQSQEDEDSVAERLRGLGYLD